jgi:hypothetical protein
MLMPQKSMVCLAFMAEGIQNVIDLENGTTVSGSDEITAYIKSSEFVAVVVRRRRV